MKTNFITLLISLAVFMATLCARQTFFTGSSAHGRYYVAAILMISGILTAIALFRLIRLHRNRPMSADSSDRKISGRPRQHYRIRFDKSPWPIFVEKTADHQPTPEFTCQVLDISETGISLGCTGVYAHGQTVQGEIIFDSGRTAPVNGMVVREEADRTCLRLHCTIDPPLLLAEQREQIIMEKADGPRPAVSKTVLGTTAGSLPSHHPKGICRLKRP
ncbi:MAG: PilZ domain-containing protein [Desulfosarcina sp.]|nr:PilZ domain-containing protein [Desulfosarcina sp.]MBC2742098.1 PilZ domain-containing protein [Desulfosarcina sp.]MBC2765011.1 PilZ domain-containing protein [Desulfosarcina sp.]